MYKEKIESLLEKHMTEKSFKLWKGITGLLPDIWDRPTSSTGKYHKKLDGRIPDQGEHAYEMLYAAIKVWRLFGIESKTTDADALLFAISLHDSLKYGKFGDRKHSDYNHDQLGGDMIKQNKSTFLRVLNENQYELVEEAIRFHSGRWSTDVGKENMDKFDWSNYKPYTFFVHLLDMFSTADVIQTDERG